MMTLPMLIFIFMIHWFADFCLQTDEQAKKKSTDLIYLNLHVTVYSVVWGICSYVVFADWKICFIFALITFTTHWLIDFVTSRIGKQFWDKGDAHNGFVMVGFDQILHHLQLIITIIWLKDLQPV